MADGGAIVFLVFIFGLIVALMYVYQQLKSEAWDCLHDPGGRGKRKKKKKKGYREDSNPESDSDDENFRKSPANNLDEKIRVGLVKTTVQPGVKALSAYGDIGAMDHESYPEHDHGRIKFDVGYSRDQFYLKVRILECDSLPKHDGTMNYRICLILLPKKQQKFSTKSMASTTPKFNQTFVFKDISQADLPKTIVLFQLFGASGRAEKTLGETFFQLASFVKMNSPVFEGIWRSFQPLSSTR